MSGDINELVMRVELNAYLTSQGRELCPPERDPWLYAQDLMVEIDYKEPDLSDPLEIGTARLTRRWLRDFMQRYG